MLLLLLNIRRISVLTVNVFQQCCLSRIFGWPKCKHLKDDHLNALLLLRLSLQHIIRAMSHTVFHSGSHRAAVTISQASHCLLEVTC